MSRAGIRLALTGLSLLVGCAAPPPLEIHLSRDVERPARAAVIFLVDGLDRGRTEALLARGQLPHIAWRFVRGGTRVENAVTSMPSITYPNAASLLTGDFPGHHGVVDNQWFDRRALAFQNYLSVATYKAANQDFRAATLYEILADKFTVNVQCPVHRGATYTIDNFTASCVDWFMHWYPSVDERVGRMIEQVADVAEGIKRWPSVMLFYFPGVDEIGHEYGSNSGRYADEMRHVDKQIGRVCDALEHAGLADSTCFVLVSDHGHVPTPRNQRFAAADWIRRERHMTVYSEKPRKRYLQIEETYRSLFEQLSSVEAIVMAGSSRCLAIHLRGSGGWPHAPKPEEVEAFITASPAIHKQPGVEMALMRIAPGRVRLYSRNGQALIERRCEGDAKSYRVVEMKGDPLGFQSSTALAAFAEAGWHGSREWLAATAAATYPDFVPQVVEMFDSPRCGDVVLFAAEQWSFDSKNAGGHGSCVASDMRIPLYFAGPGIKTGGTIAAARIVDVMPTVVDLLGEGPRMKNFPATDGVSLRDVLMSESTQPALGAAMGSDED